MRSCEHIKYYKFQTKLYNAVVLSLDLEYIIFIIENYLKSLTCNNSYCRKEYILSLSYVFNRACVNINSIIKDNSQIEPLTNILVSLLDCGARLPATPEFIKNLYNYPQIIKKLLPYTSKKFDTYRYEFSDCSIYKSLLVDYISNHCIQKTFDNKIMYSDI